jgi:hypothetical protein
MLFSTYSDQYSETNTMHFSFNWLRIKGLYMFQALLAHRQEVLRKRNLVYCVRITLVGCSMVAVSLQTCYSQLTYTRNIPNAICTTPPEDEQVMLKTCRGLWFSINWMKSSSCWFHYTDILWCMVSKTLSLHTVTHLYIIYVCYVVHQHPTSIPYGIVTH